MAKRPDPPPPKATASYPQGQEPKQGAPAAPEFVRGRVILWAEKAHVTLVLRHSAPAQVLNEATGGWEVIEIPEELPVLHWTSSKAVKIRLTLLADGYFAQTSVEPDLESLRSLTVKGQLKTPPSLKVIGKVPYQTTRWVIDALDIVEQEHIGVSGQCCRALATIDLVAYRAPGDTTAVNPKATALTKARTHLWQSGDTLHDLAEHYLGDPDRFNSIRKANDHPTKANKGIKHWSLCIPGKTVINIPSAASVS